MEIVFFWFAGFALKVRLVPLAHAKKAGGSVGDSARGLGVAGCYLGPVLGFGKTKISIAAAPASGYL